MNESVAYVDSANDIKDAVERAEDERELRRKYLERKHGKYGAQVALLKEEAARHTKQVWGQ